MSRTGLLLVAVGLHWLVLCGSSPADTAQTDEARLYFESLLAKVHRRKSVSEHDQLLEELTTSALGVPVTFGDDVPIDANYRKETTAEDKYLPVVQMHGLGDFAANPLGMLPLKFAISRWLDGTYVTNIALGQSLPVVGGIPVVSDELSAYFLSLQKSVDEFAAIVRNDTKLRNGFNAIGYSQGNLIIRGYVQQYNKPPVANWISMHGPLLGVAGIPSCNTTTLLCQQIDEFLGYLAYDSVFQDWFTPADYYKDVMKLLEYESSSSFLADLNNETPRGINETYVRNFQSLSSLALVKALGDETVFPNDSEWLGFFVDNVPISENMKYNFTESKYYKDDLFGAAELYDTGRMHFHSTDGPHMAFTNEFLKALVLQYFTDPAA